MLTICVWIDSNEKQEMVNVILLSKQYMYILAEVGIIKIV